MVVLGNPFQLKFKEQSMKFIPCQDHCTHDGTHCNGCGRSHEEIAAISQLVAAIVQHTNTMNYENVEEFTQFLARKAHRRVESARTMEQEAAGRLIKGFKSAKKVFSVFVPFFCSLQEIFLSHRL